jgi:ABC-type lipoprotein export system ATPase subunit
MITILSDFRREKIGVVFKTNALIDFLNNPAVF